MEGCERTRAKEMEARNNVLDARLLGREAGDRAGEVGGPETPATQLALSHPGRVHIQICLSDDWLWLGTQGDKSRGAPG